MWINRYIFVFGITLTFLWTVLCESLECDCNRPTNIDVSKTKVYVINFQTNKNTTYYVEEAAEKILNQSDFDSKQCVHMFVPGFSTTLISLVTNVFTCSLSTTFCDNGKKPLVIVVDHSQYLDIYYLQKIQTESAYKSTIKFVKPIGISLAKMIVKLLTKINRDQLTILGHSLGAHVIGYMGDYIKNTTRKPLKSLYAADPAGPCYSTCPNEHVKSDNAEMVIAFHFNEGYLGTNLNLSHFDFYSGNGFLQDECDLNISTPLLKKLENFCSHNSGVPIVCTPYVLRKGWKSVKCSSAKEFLDGNCNNNEFTYAGYGITPNGSYGVYYFQPSKDLKCVKNALEIYIDVELGMFTKERGIFEKIANTITSIFKT